MWVFPSGVPGLQVTYDAMRVHSDRWRVMPPTDRTRARFRTTDLGVEFRCGKCRAYRSGADFFFDDPLFAGWCQGCRRAGKGGRFARAMEVLRYISVQFGKGKGVIKRMEDQTTRERRLPERIAAVIGKTHALQGDNFTLIDDDAINRIVDLLEETHPGIVDRNKDKRLPRVS